ncbi:hypothetical protein GCM10025876_06850 [Demequina litorisediminis]|uniref:(R)-citramalate synthase n=1 Tax=Demequina litorisediminis TaxID=1849022 RepID=A0ABQ6I9T3_9MICO|nr:hypothetical protein GCM10025876_06850 [Demequina litorisediminis]
MTRKAGTTAGSDPQVRALLDSEAPIITLVCKSDIRHAERALRVSPDENLAMIEETFAFLTGEGRRVIMDAEHFFDGYRFDPEYTIRALLAAANGGADTLCLCDTNGGMLPEDVTEIVAAVRARVDLPLGMHAHNDSGCAVANSMAAVAAGATHVQGCINGYGERTGNADIISVVANLELKKGLTVLKGGGLTEATRIAHAISEITNIAPFARQPYVGASAFAHKAGLHASAIRVDPDLYQHTEPEHVGNGLRMLVSDMAGRASIELKGKEPRLRPRGPGRVARSRHRPRQARGGRRLHVRRRGCLLRTPAAVRTGRGQRLLGRRDLARARLLQARGPHRCRRRGRHQGSTPGESAMSPSARATAPSMPSTTPCAPHSRRPTRRSRPSRLTDFKVRIMDASHGTDAITRVLITTVHRETGRRRRTVGVGPNVIEAAWEAMVDSLVYGLIKEGVERR